MGRVNIAGAGIVNVERAKIEGLGTSGELLVENSTIRTVAARDGSVLIRDSKIDARGSPGPAVTYEPPAGAGATLILWNTSIDSGGGLARLIVHGDHRVALILARVKAVLDRPVVEAEGSGKASMLAVGSNITSPGPLAEARSSASINATIALSIVNITRGPLARGAAYVQVARSLLWLAGSPTTQGAKALLYLNYIAGWAEPPTKCPVNVSLNTSEALSYRLEERGGGILQSPLGNYYAWLNTGDNNSDGISDVPAKVGCLVDEYPLAVSPSDIAVTTPPS